MKAHTHSFAKRMLLAAMAAIVWIGFGSSIGFAQSNLNSKLKSVAAKIDGFLKREGVTDKGIKLGSFRAPKKAAINPGPGMFHILERELRKLGVDTSPGSVFTINGEYRLHELDGGKREAELLWKIENDGKTVFVVNANLTNSEDIDLFFPPPSVIDDTKVLAREGSPLAAEVLVGGNARKPSFSPDFKPNMAFVELKEKDRFAIRLHNSSRFCMAVLLRVDAISIWAFSGPDRQWRVIVPANSSVTIKGWHRNGADWDDFEITGYPKSMRKDQNLPPDDSHVGVISMSYRFCQRVGTSDLEPPGLKAGAKAQSNTRVFAGKAGKKSRLDTSVVDSIMGEPQETVIIRYSK